MNFSTKFLPLACALTVAMGCAHFQPRPLAPEQSAAAFESRRLDDPGLRTFLAQNGGDAPTNWPRAAWDLNSLTLAALYFHPDLAVARAQWDLARAGVKTAGARPNPSVSFSPAYDTQIPDNPSPWILPVTFDLPIETAGKRGQRIAQAEKAAESARWNFVSQAWQVRSGVRAALLDFHLAGRRAALLEQQLAVQRKIMGHLRGQIEAGAISRAELMPAQMALHKSELDLSDARARQTDARSRLAESLGVSLAALEGLDLRLDSTPPAVARLTSTEARGVALRERADILAALADYASAEANLRLQIAKQFPDLHLGPDYAWNNGNAGDNQWSLGVTLELPILDQNQGPIAEAEAQRKLSAAKFLALQAQVCGQIDRAVAGWQAARGQLRTGEQLVAAGRQAEQSAKARFAAGAGEPLDLLNAQLDTANAGLTQLDGEERLQSALGTLEDALQQPADSLAAAIRKMSSPM